MRLFIWSLAFLAIYAELVQVSFDSFNGFPLWLLNMDFQENQPATAEENNVQASKNDQDNDVQSAVLHERERRFFACHRQCSGCQLGLALCSKKLSATSHNMVLKVTASCPGDSWHSSIISGAYIARGTYGGRISYENTKRDANKNWWRLVYVRNRGWEFTYSHHRVGSGPLNQTGYKSSDYVYLVNSYRKSRCTFRIYPL